MNDNSKIPSASPPLVRLTDAEKTQLRPFILFLFSGSSRASCCLRLGISIVTDNSTAALCSWRYSGIYMKQMVIPKEMTDSRSSETLDDTFRAPGAYGDFLYTNHGATCIEPSGVAIAPAAVTTVP